MVLTDQISDWYVLVVDDEPDNLGVVEKVLRFHGARVITARNGLEGLELLRSNKPTFVLLDLSMPKLDGWATFRFIRENPVTADLPVIALTAHAMDNDRERVMDAGFDGYMTKPFRLLAFLEDLRRCLRAVIEKREKARATELNILPEKPPAPFI